MNRLYIPELGDKIILAKDWTFNLYPERRNTDLLENFNFYFYSNSIILKEDLPEFEEKHFDVNYPKLEDFYKTNFIGKKTFDSDAYNKAFNQALKDTPGYLEHQEERREWYDKANKLIVTNFRNSIPFTLPKNTELTVDRIYIRKGAKEYSSITFYAKRPEQKKKVRFWVKLSDCNNIIFE